MKRLFDYLHHISAGPRLLACLVLGAAIFLWPFEPRDVMVHAGAAWVIGVLLFLGWTLYAVSGVSKSVLRKRARDLDDSAWIVSLLVVIASGISLLALGMMISSKDGGADSIKVLRIVLAGTSMICAWFLIHTVLALHYAHLYYGDKNGNSKDCRGGLDFPGEDDPEYSDFFYYSFTIGMTCQVSDVTTQSRGMRRLTLLHSVVSFFFNTTVIALTVNLVAGSSS